MERGRSVLKSRLPQIAAEVLVRSEIAAEAAARLVEAKAKARVPVGGGEVHLRDRIHIENGDEPGEVYVVMGDREAFYGHIVEYGSVHAAPHPFAIPAAAEAVGEINTLGRAAFRDL
jgi:HK97 gp10 family phage protein